MRYITYILLSLLLLSATPAAAQWGWARYQLSDTIRERHQAQPEEFPYYKAAGYLSFIGEHKPALYMMDTHGKLTDHEPFDTAYYKSLKPLPALDHLLKMIGNERIVILNEARHMPQHRVFAELLISKLRDKGFTHLALEALSATDTAINERGHAVVSSGFYIAEPCFGNMVHTALEKGYELIPYEADVEALNAHTADRERRQAMNIARLLNTDPEARVIIYCGYQHAREDSFLPGGMAMAGLLKEMTGIDPFTVSQTEFTSTSSPAYENPAYHAVWSDTYAVFRDTMGHILGGTDSPAAYDVLLYHPRTEYIQGRPEWVYYNGRKPQRVNHLITTGYPCLLRAYRSDEYIDLDGNEKTEWRNAVPADAIELQSKDDPKPLSLQKGSYTIFIEDAEGHRQILEIK